MRVVGEMEVIVDWRKISDYDFLNNINYRQFRRLIIIEKIHTSFLPRRGYMLVAGGKTPGKSTLLPPRPVRAAHYL
jgi:hypothetical protein